MKLIIACALLFAISIQLVNAIGIGRKQSAGIRGDLVCDGKPATHVKVKLYDDDRGLDADDLMASGKTDSRGHFEIQGFSHEFTTIDPKLNIYHDCNDGIKPCQRKISVTIPDKYVSDGERPKKIYDAGRIELSGKFKGESRDCVN